MAGQIGQLISGAFSRRKLNETLARYGYRLEKMSPETIKNDHNKRMEALHILARGIASQLRRSQNGRVASGPFKGLLLSDINPWSPSDIASRYLGCYEQELHPALESEIARRPQRVINIGCGDGYYACGLALRLPGSKVVAFDPSDEAAKATQKTAELNGLSSRIEVRGRCARDDLIAVAQDGAFIFCDCEGAEIEIFDDTSIAALKTASVMIECHDFADARITPRLHEVFRATHDVIDIASGPRNPHILDDFAKRPSHEQWLAVCEFRPQSMSWLWCQPKSPQ